MEKDKEKVEKSKLEVLYLIIGIILIILLAIAAFKLLELTINVIKMVFDNYPTISVALITGLLAFISVPVGKYCENMYTIKDQIRKERRVVYLNFLDWLVKNLLNSEITNNGNIVQEIKDNQNQMILYASDKVIKAWTDFRDSTLKSGKIKKDMSPDENSKYFLENEAPALEKLILEIRKELGYKNKHIKKYDILNLYINDIDNYIDRTKYN